ncbi:MAG: hypothetical protein RLZZ488_77 [Pseudomonadota bacterium]|jgi:rod shape-determining protein MreB
MDYWILGSGFLQAYLGVMFGLGANFCMSVDFGTSNTLVFLRDEGVVVNQASLLALRTDKEKPNSFQIFDAGNDVSPLVGRTAPQICIESPLCSGVIRNTELAKALLQALTEKFLPWSRFVPFRRSDRGILISAPREVTEYERNAFYEAARSLGFLNVALIDEPLAAALGSGLPIFASKGQMLVDLGSGITEAIVISSGMVVESGSFRRGGNDLDNAIVTQLENEHRFRISQVLAREIKERHASVRHSDMSGEIVLSGKCLKTKLPRKTQVQLCELYPAVSQYVDQVEGLIVKVLERSEPELVTDVSETGVWLSGGGALLKGLPEALTRRLGIQVRCVEDPLCAVIAGNGRVVNEPELYSLCRR